MKSIKTTIVGAVLIIAGIYTGVKNNDWVQASTIITIGCGFFLAKDYDKTGK